MKTITDTKWYLCIYVISCIQSLQIMCAVQLSSFGATPWSHLRQESKAPAGHTKTELSVLNRERLFGSLSYIHNVLKWNEKVDRPFYLVKSLLLA